jgi:hypothetical protein
MPLPPRWLAEDRGHESRTASSTEPRSPHRAQVQMPSSQGKSAAQSASHHAKQNFCSASSRIPSVCARLRVCVRVCLCPGFFLVQHGTPPPSPVARTQSPSAERGRLLPTRQKTKWPSHIGCHTSIRRREHRTAKHSDGGGCVRLLPPPLPLSLERREAKKSPCAADLEHLDQGTPKPCGPP